MPDTAEKITSISLKYADGEGPDHTDGQRFDSLKDLNRRFSGVEAKEGRRAKIAFEDGEILKANANQNGWSAFGRSDGLQWQTEDYPTLNSLVRHLQERKRVDADRSAPNREAMDAYYDADNS
jgi:hypothetical protein